VYDNYGTNELGAGAFECQHRNGLHVMEDAIYLEILDTETNEPVQPGKVGNLVATVFPRHVMPSIRYNRETSVALCPRSAAIAAAISSAWTTS
jgi:phenylacetate-CoA ligase